MSKQPRHQTVISRQSDAPYSEDHWLRQFEEKLQKTSVQPRGKSVYDEITSIMNSKSKYPSVRAAVDDMMHRSGLTNYLETVKESQEKIPEETATKTAQDETGGFHVPPKDKAKMDHIPDVIQQVPAALKTLENIIKDSRGNLPISAIIARLHSLHAKDTADESVWEDDDLIRLVSKMNLEAKKNNPGVFERFDMLGKGEHGTADSDVDPSNTDAFNILMPAKI